MGLYLAWFDLSPTFTFKVKHEIVRLSFMKLSDFGNFIFGLSYPYTDETSTALCCNA
jgi:hypothetical protein